MVLPLSTGNDDREDPAPGPHPSTRRRLLASTVVAAILLASAPANASFVEENTPLAYQADGTGHHDAPDTCQAGPTFRPSQNTGLVVPSDDERDHYALPITSDHVGERVILTLTPSSETDLALDAYDPTCSTLASVCEGTSDDGTGADIACANLEEHACADGAWELILNQLRDDDSPASVHVVWANGAEQDIPLTKRSGGVAHYETTDHLGTAVVEATVEVPEGWSGRFNLGSGPCVEDDDVEHVTFVPQTEGDFVVSVALVGLPGEEPAASRTDAPDLLGPQPASCHSFCVGAIETMNSAVGYSLR